MHSTLIDTMIRILLDTAMLLLLLRVDTMVSPLSDGCATTYLTSKVVIMLASQASPLLEITTKSLLSRVIVMLQSISVGYATPVLLS